jgi:hypothetical protein
MWFLRFHIFDPQEAWNPMPDLHLRLRDTETGEEHHQASIPEADALDLLTNAEISTATLVPWGSNYTFAVALESEEGGDHLGIYKPRRGERPLWDFPTGTLYLREHASYLLSSRLGWNLVPPTVIRQGPHGVGSLQLYIEPNPEREDDYDFWGEKRDEIERMALFDQIANNADRKISHCLVSMHGELWGIDHGLTFNVDPKLRTILWQYVGEPVSPALLDDLTTLAMQESLVRCQLEQHLDPNELDALFARVLAILKTGRFPELNPSRNIPSGWW